MRRGALCLCIIAFLTTLSLGFGQAGGKNKKPQPSAPAHLMVTPDAVKWELPQPSWVQGTPPPEFQGQPPFTVAVLEGDPTKMGAPFVLRLKTPDGYKVAPHWHPQDENITIIQGTFYLATGDKFDQNAGHALTAGAYALMPRRVHHFGWSEGETIIQVHGLGPFKIIFLNPAAGSPQKPKAK